MKIECSIEGNSNVQITKTWYSNYLSKNPVAYNNKSWHNNILCELESNYNINLFDLNSC
jgi:hypothetical protein